MPARKVDMNQVMGYEDDELSQYMSFNQMKASPVSSHNVQPPPAQNANGAGLHEAFDTTSPAGMLSGMPPSVSVANVAAPVVPDATVGVVPLPAPAAFTPTNANVDADANATWLGRWLGPSWADLLLFSVAGLLLLLLLDLLFRLATQVGMRDTLQTLEAIAARLAANAPQKGGILTGAPLDFEMPSLLPFPEVACGQV